MFWYRRKTIEELRRIAASFTPTEKSDLQNECKLFLHGNKLAFNKKDDTYIVDNELFFIRCLLRVANDKKTILAKINEALSSSQLSYDDGKIINKQGACALVREEIVEGKKLIRKTTLQREIKTEFDILSYFNKVPNNYVIQLIDSPFDGESFLMESAQDSLETYIETHPNLSINERISIVKKIIDCVVFIHSNNIIHRDLHPGNFLLVRSANASIWKLSDFGFACSIADASKLVKDIDKHSYGRPDYTAPEQIISLANSTFRSEIYSIGKLINFIIRKSPNNNAHIFHDISDQCCKKNPNDRYESIFEIKRLVDIESYRFNSN